MTDEASFLVAIAAAPDDQNLPLVFADWLDDHGDPRGQWIRSHHVRPWMGPTFQNPVPALLEALANDRRVIEVRRAAEVVGEPMVPGLVELLKHELPRVRKQACMCLRRIGRRAKAAVPALLEALSDAVYSVREQAAKALKDIGTDQDAGTDQLKAALTDDNWSVRRVASEVLGSMRAKGDVLAELVERLESPDVKERKEAITALAQLGTKDAVAPLDRMLDDPEAEVREAAVRALARLKLAAVVPPLCRAMKDPAVVVRMAAAEQFGRYRTDVPLTPPAVTSLAGLLADTSEVVRAAACVTLSGAGSLAASAVPRLVELLDDAAPGVVVAAVRALGELAGGDKAALSALIDKLTASDREVRHAAVRAVGVVGRDDPEALAALVPRLDDRADDVAYAAAEQIREWAKLPASAARPLLARFARLRGTPAGLYNTYSVLVALGRIESPPPEVVETLSEVVRDPQGYDLSAALEALAGVGPAAAPAIPDVVALFHNGNAVQPYHTYHAAVKVLVRVGGRGLDELGQLLDGGNECANWYVLQACGELRDAALPLLPVLLRQLRRARDSQVRGRVIGAIRHLGPGATDAIPALLDGLETWDAAHDRGDALVALSEFGTAVLPHLPRLIELSRRAEFAGFRPTFASLFARFAPRVAEVREALRELLRAAAPGDPNDWNARWAGKDVRRSCAGALLAFNDPSLLPDLAPLVTDPEPDIRGSMVYLLDRLDTPAVLPLIRQALGDTEEDVRLRAVEVLTRRNDASPETVAALVRAVEDRVPKVRRAAIDALGKLKAGGEHVLAALAAATEDADKKVAERAAIALKKVTPKEPKVKSAKDKKTPG